MFRLPLVGSSHAGAHQLKERVSLRKHHDERLALRSQMNVEETERRQIEEIKAEQKEKAEVRSQYLYLITTLRSCRL